MTYELKWRDDMGEISGFGGGYEATCRKMVLAGVAWLIEHPKADPKWNSFKNVVGLTFDENADAKEMEEAMLVASGNDCTGAMMQACMQHCLFVKTNGWDRYVDELRKRTQEGQRNGDG